MAVFVSAQTVSWAQASDAETSALEVGALCRAMPYNCPQGAGSMTREDLRAIEARSMVGARPPDPLDQQCPGLIPSIRIIRDKVRWQVPLSGKDREESETWRRDCLRWHGALDGPPSSQWHGTTRCTSRNENNMVRHPYDAEWVTTCISY